jgi:Methyltransferase domain
VNRLSPAKERVFAHLRKHPAAHARARRAYLAFWQRRVALGEVLAGAPAELPRALCLDAGRIRRAGVGWIAHGGPVRPGDWDLSTILLAESDAYRATRDEVGRATPEQRAALAARAADGRAGIRVRIGRDGEVLAEHGLRGLAAAQLLDVPSVPVTLTVRHAEWAGLRNQLRAYAAESAGKLYQPAAHPDLADIPAAHDDTRLRLLRPHLPGPSGALLDIGANLGFFCHALEAEGFDCYAVERGVREFYFLHRLRAAEGKRFQTIHADICDFTARTAFDVVLALNVFHHFLKTEAEHARLVDLLGRLQTPLLAFEPHDPAEGQMRGAYRNYGPEEFVEFVRARGGFARARRIGEDAGDNRPLYLLTR